MNKKIITILSITLLTANMALADYSYIDSSDFTGDSFFTSPSMQKQENVTKEKKHYSSMPPLKKVRIKIKNKMRARRLQKMQLAPVAPVVDTLDTEISKYASQDIKDDFDETMMPDGFEADTEAIEETQKKHFWQRNNKSKKQQVEDTESIVLECDNVDYDTDKYSAIATGNVSVLFVKQGSTLKADRIIYDRMNNTIRAEGNVKIIKKGKVVTGEYIFVDLNEENALVEKPFTETSVIQMKAQKAYVYGDRVIQENGRVDVDKSTPIEFRSMKRGPRLSDMLLPEDEELLKNENKGDVLSLKSKNITITEKGDLEIISLKKAEFFKGKKRILKIPAVKLYTNKNLDFVESNIFEIGNIRGLGLYAGPGYVFEIPGGSVLKAMPILNYKSGFGVGAVARYSSASNWTQLAYGTAENSFLVRGKQDLDDNLYLQYGVNDYMREWFLGRRRPKYGVSLVYENGYQTKNFLVKNQSASFDHRIDVGYYHDSDKDSHMRRRSGHQIGTTRARYMAQVRQNLYSYTNKEKQIAFNVGVVGQLAASIYGTGDTQTIGRIGPVVHTQYKRWMQDIGYYQSAYDDNSPMPIFDSYRYGTSNIYFRENFRVSKYLTLSWFASINASGDAPNGRNLQENAFYITLGPEDIKFSLGYDVERERTLFIVQVMMDAKGTNLEYEKLEIKQDKKAKVKETIKDESLSDFQKPKNQPILDHAIIENVRTTEDVL